MERMSLDERAKIFMADFRSGMTLREIKEKHGVGRIEYVSLVLNRDAEYRAIRKRENDKHKALYRKVTWLVREQGYGIPEVARRYGITARNADSIAHNHKRWYPNNNAKKVKVTDVDTGEVRVFQSLQEASEELYYSRTTIARKIRKDNPRGQIDREFRIEYVNEKNRPLDTISEEEIEKTMACGGNLNR